MPADDVAFTPGKAADCRDVAPAVLDDARSQLPDVIPILITVELHDLHDLLFDADALIGPLVFDRVERRFASTASTSGDPEQRLLAAQCRTAMTDPAAD